MCKKIVIYIILVIISVCCGWSMAARIYKTKWIKASQLADKHLALYMLMNYWVRQKNRDKTIASYLNANDYKTVAIYGMNYVGEVLLEELTKSDIEVLYAIDQNADKIFSDVKVVKPEDELFEVDAIIVTAITAFDSIERYMLDRVKCPILSVEDILYEL